ncbi:MAG: hypothetical protein DHS20C18_39220 [Saprospiraceae bacterium]|nr:MAG: hypothetical protein DHS20C18_39220 [Saprospiraceae bacterium]
MWALNYRGYVFIQIKEYKEAAFDLNKAIYLDPQFAEAYCNRALLNLQTNDLEGAKEDLQTAMSLNETLPYNYLHLGLYHQKSGDFALALEQFNKAKAMNIDYRKIDLLIDEMERQTNNF